MKLRRLIVCVIVTALFGCQIWKDKTVPEELLGMWETSSSRYADCFFEFQGELIIFNNGLSYNDINFIKDIEKLPEKGKTLYNIYYEDKEGQEFKLSLFYFQVRNGGVIRFKNQKDIEWTRRRKQAVPHIAKACRNNDVLSHMIRLKGRDRMINMEPYHEIRTKIFPHQSGTSDLHAFYDLCHFTSLGLGMDIF